MFFFGSNLAFHFRMIGPCNLWMNHPSYTTLSSDPRWIPRYYSTNQAEANQIIRNCSSLFKIDFLNTCIITGFSFYLISSILGMTSVFFANLLSDQSTSPLLSSSASSAFRTLILLSCCSKDVAAESATCIARLRSAGWWMDVGNCNVFQQNPWWD